MNTNINRPQGHKLYIMITKEFKLQNGDSVEETVTGFKGIITGTCFYLTGCTQYLVTAKAKDGVSEATAVWYDEARLIFIEKGITKEELESDENGCDIPPTQGKRGA